MPAARFWFQPDLHLFLPPERREGAWQETFESGQTIKHLIESAGLPHTEVGEVRVNGLPVSLDDKAQEGDQVEVIAATAQNAPLSIDPRFILDTHLGRLAAYLRMLGFDARYQNFMDDEELANLSAQEERILLTRDRRLLMRKIVHFGYCLRSLDSRQQLSEVVKRFALDDKIQPFQRCLRCNTPLQPVTKAEVLPQLEPLTQKYYDEFHRCPACGQIYWKGSHYQHMQDLIKTIHGRSTSPTEG